MHIGCLIWTLASTTVRLFFHFCLFNDRTRSGSSRFRPWIWPRHARLCLRRIDAEFSELASFRHDCAVFATLHSLARHHPRTWTTGAQKGRLCAIQLLARTKYICKAGWADCCRLPIHRVLPCHPAAAVLVPALSHALPLTGMPALTSLIEVRRPWSCCAEPPAPRLSSGCSFLWLAGHTDPRHWAASRRPCCPRCGRPSNSNPPASCPFLTATISSDAPVL